MDNLTRDPQEAAMTRTPNTDPGTDPITANICGAWHPNPITRRLNPASLTCVRSLAFAGEWDDGTISERFTTCARFDIYREAGDFLDRSGLVVRRISGLGSEWLVIWTTNRRVDLLSDDDGAAHAMLQAIYAGIRHHRTDAHANARGDVLRAHAEGRLRRRKVRNADTYRVWIED